MTENISTTIKTMGFCGPCSASEPAEVDVMDGRIVRIRPFDYQARGAEGGKLYGSVTAQEIADELFKQYGVKVEKRRIDVANIRNAGDFTVSVWLYAGITAEMTAKVEIG